MATFQPSEQWTGDQAELKRDADMVYKKYMEILQESAPGVLLDSEIEQIKKAYPSFAQLTRALASNNNQFGCQPELLLSFQLKIHPIASLHVCNGLTAAPLGWATLKWRESCTINPNCTDELRDLDEYWRLEKQLDSLIDNWGGIDNEEDQKELIYTD